MPNGYNPQLSFSVPGLTGNYGNGLGDMMGIGSGSGNSGWLTKLGTTLMGPAGVPINLGLGLVSGILSGIAAGQKRKQGIKAYQKQQQAYQTKANELFPELSKESFQYTNPQLTNAYQSGLGYVLQNLFNNWNAPQGQKNGLGSLMQMFQGLMGTPNQSFNPMPIMGMPQGGGQGGGGGWQNQMMQAMMGPRRAPMVRMA
jgi:hypothetical protein